MTAVVAPPATDDELGEIIRAGAKRLAVELDATQVDRLVAYLHLIARWNSTYNLTAVRELRAMATQHVVDSLSAIPTLDRLMASASGRRLLDVGSGAGLPGVVVAIARPKLEITCIDSVGKKAAFITAVSATLSLPNLAAIHGRVEQIRSPPTYGVIVSRAFASLADFVASTRHLLERDGQWLAMKGKIPTQELNELVDHRVVFKVQNIEVPDLGAERCLLTGMDIAESEC